MSRKNRPYHFYDTTTGICNECHKVIEAKIIFKNNHVYMNKWCPNHGMQRVLISDDADYYRLGREVFVKRPEMPQRFNTEMHYGCPYDCGLCPDHMQHSCLSIVEINRACNLNCPVCFASSGTHQTEHYPIEIVEKMLDAIVANEGEPDVVQLSGGEPTIHPQFFDILAAARKRPIKHLMINTNGVRIAQDFEFVEKLAQSGLHGLEIYLQFDSLDNEVTQTLRGADLSRIRKQALDNLNRVGLSTTLVVTVAKGVNDHDIGNIIRFATKQPCVRGVTLQPIQFAGRTENVNSKNRLTVSEIRRKIIEQSDIFSTDDIMPVPCNPDTLAMAYAFKDDSGIVPLTRYLDPKTLVENANNTIVFEHDHSLKDHIFKLFSTNHSPESQANCLSELMCCLPEIAAPQQFGYQNVFRILIVQFMDAENLDIRSLKKSCIHFATPDGKLIPFESYNLFYRPEMAAKLTNIRNKIDTSNMLWQTK